MLLKRRMTHWFVTEMNQYVSSNRFLNYFSHIGLLCTWLDNCLSLWVIDWFSHIDLFLNEWISVSYTCVVPEWMSVLNKSCEWMTQWFTHKDGHLTPHFGITMKRAERMTEKSTTTKKSDFNQFYNGITMVYLLTKSVLYSYLCLVHFEPCILLF